MIGAWASFLAGLLPLYIVRFSVMGIPTNLFEAAVWGAAVCALAIPSARMKWWYAIRSIPRPYKIWMLCFLVAAVLATIHSPILRSSAGILKGWIVTPMVFGSLLMAFADRRQGIRALSLSAVVVALLGISQIDGLARISSLSDVPNSLSLFLVPVAVLAIGTGIREKDRVLQAFSLPMLAAIMTTQSFGALFALVGTALVGVSLSPPAHWRREGVRVKAAYGAALILVLSIAIFVLSGRISYILAPLTHPGATNSATVRLQLWDIGTDLIKKSPMLGIGLGQFEPAYQQELHRKFTSEDKEANAAISYRLQPEFVFRDPHNWIISFWLNTGLLGLLSFIALNYLAVKSLPSPIALALISMLLFGLVDTIYWKNDLSALWWLLWFFLREED